MEIIVLNFRYLAAVGISLVIHTALIWSVPEKKAFAMPTGSQSSQVNIQLVAPSSPAISSEKKALATPNKPKETVTKKIEIPKKPSKINKQETPVKTSQAPIKKKVEKTQKEPVEKSVTKTNVAKTDNTAKSAVSKSGATEKPQLVKKPSFLKRPNPPRYPRIAQRKGIEGIALYEIWLNENGKQVKQQLITSSGASVLDEAALNAIRDWKFSPQVINGQAIAHRVQIPVRFSLN
ncbi:TonB family protein [Aliivibrio salmonicida]|uniref:TonB family protein n=1 Tax=Aliivibrio salmonicida TaxID=40269 RepID=UPI00406CF281